MTSCVYVLTDRKTNFSTWNTAYKGLHNTINAPSFFSKCDLLNQKTSNAYFRHHPFKQLVHTSSAVSVQARSCLVVCMICLAMCDYVGNKQRVSGRADGCSSRTWRRLTRQVTFCAQTASRTTFATSVTQVQHQSNRIVRFSTTKQKHHEACGLGFLLLNETFENWQHCSPIIPLLYRCILLKPKRLCFRSCAASSPLASICKDY